MVDVTSSPSPRPTLTADREMVRTVRLARQLGSARRMVEGYKALLAVAETMGMEYEVERLTASLAEYEDDLARQLAGLGHGARL